MTAADQAEASAEEGAGATNVPVQPGEKLTERQLLNGLLVHSANNFADVLARWDAGTVPAFVAKMNATARRSGDGAHALRGRQRPRPGYGGHRRRRAAA